MIDVSAAISTAKYYLESVFAAEGYKEVRLEEATLTDDDRFWLITFGFDQPQLGGTLWRKDYKVVKVDSQSGQARGVQIRELV